MKTYILSVLIVFLGSTSAFACSCIETNAPLVEKVKNAFSKADVIINATVVGIKKISKGNYISSADPIVYTFKVSKYFKGKLKTDTIEIVSASSSASCGYKFKLGTSYLVYAKSTTTYARSTQHATDYVTSLCDRNKVLHTAVKEELKTLKKLKCKLK